METTAQIINNKVNSIFVKGLIARNGWTKQQAADYVLEFVTSGTKFSFGDFMKSKAERCDFASYKVYRDGAEPWRGEIVRNLTLDQARNDYVRFPLGEHFDANGRKFTWAFGINNGEKC